MPQTPVALQSTPLAENHIRRGAKMVDFSGWNMPLQYGKVIAEHMAVREAAGLFDVSHMGLVVVTSGDAIKTRDALNQIIPQDLTKLVDGKAVYSQFLNSHGGIIDDIIVYQLPALSQFSAFTEYLIVCNAGNVKTDIAWLKQQLPPDVTATLVSADFSLFALQGPKFSEVLSRLGITQLPKRFHIAEAKTNTGIPVLLARTGYTGEDGVEVIVPNAHVNALWDGLLDTGADLGLVPVGLAARDTLRLEAAYPLHGHDISENDTPLEAGLGWSVKLNKDIDFIGKAALLKQQAEGLPKLLTCFKMKKKSIARQHDAILQDGKRVGEVTSGSISPLWQEAIGMGYIQTAEPLKPGTELAIEIRGNAVPAEVVERPFYKKI